MKKILILVLMSIIFLSSCEKKELINTDNQSIDVVDQYTFDELKVTEGILVFPNIEVFEHVYTLLDNTNDYEVFENNYGYTSLRTIIAKKMDEFNKIYDPKNTENPDDHFIADNTLRALLNENCEVIIGTSIYKYLDNGLVIEILNLNFDINKRITSNNYFQFKENEELIIHGETTCKSGDCQANISKSAYTYTYTGDTYRRLYHKITAVNVIIISDRKIKSEVKEEYYSTSQNKWVLTPNSYINSNLKGIYYEGIECDVLQNNLDYITSIIYGQWGAQNIEKDISKYFRVKSNMIYINVSTSNFSLHNYYLVF